MPTLPPIMIFTLGFSLGILFVFMCIWIFGSLKDSGVTIERYEDDEQEGE